MPLKSYWGFNEAVITTPTGFTAEEIFTFPLLADQTVEFTVNVCMTSITDDNINCSVFIDDDAVLQSIVNITDQSDIVATPSTWECASLSYSTTAASDTTISTKLAGGSGPGLSQIGFGDATFEYKIWGDGYTPVSVTPWLWFFLAKNPTASRWLNSRPSLMKNKLLTSNFTHSLLFNKL